MKTVFLALLLTFAAFTASTQTISYDGVRQDVVIDVRTPTEFSLGHINGAVNVPLDRLTENTEALKHIDRNSHILVYCRSGRRSATAMKLLEQRGFRHVRDGGGMATLTSKLKACDNHRC